MGAYTQKRLDLEIEEELEAIVYRLHILADKARVRTIDITSSKYKMTDGDERRYGTVIVFAGIHTLESRHLNNDGDLIGILQDARDKEPTTE